LNKPADSVPSNAISLAPILIWLLIELGALLLAAFRIPLAAEYPQPAEFYAVRVLLVVQFAWATMLFPSLLRTWAMTLIALCAAWVMLMLAAALSAWHIADVLPVAAFLSLWIVALGMIRAALPWKWQMVAAGLASTYVIGGALLWYLQSDFGASLPVEPAIGFGPLWIGASMPQNLPQKAWWGQVGIGLFTAVIFSASIYRKSARRARPRHIETT
jgi:hypothetical protein